MWMTVERTTGRRLGLHPLNHIQGESIIHIGFTLAKSAWGKGFGTEMAFAVLRYGFVDRNLPRIFRCNATRSPRRQKGFAALTLPPGELVGGLVAVHNAERGSPSSYLSPAFQGRLRSRFRKQRTIGL